MKKVLRAGTGEIYTFISEDEDNIVVQDDNGCIYYFSPLTETFDDYEILEDQKHDSIQSSDNLH